MPTRPDALSPDELQRDPRHLIPPRVGEEGQRRAARVLLTRAGGLGSAAALHLAAAGVGRFGIVDADAVPSNPQYRILHGTGGP
jgi:adenylyltransferase/sulfurtransferase